MKATLLRELNRRRADKRASVRAVRLGGPEERLVDLEGASDPLVSAARDAIRQDACRVVETEDGRWFLQPFNPPLRLVIVGAVHIAQPLSKMAAFAGYSITIVDPRSAFARQERFEGVDISTEWPDEALSSLGLDARTAVVTLTHDPKLDDPALEVALATPAFYVGCLGSTRTHAARLRRLEARGVPSSSLERLHGPVGLAIGARSPAEISLSILAQMTEVLRRGRR